MVNFFANSNQNLIQPVDLFYDPKTNLFAPGANVTDVPSDEGTVINGVYLTPEQKDAITVNLSNGESAVPQDFSNVPIPKRKPVLVAPVEMPEEPVAAEPAAVPVAQEQMAPVAPGTEPLPETEDPWYSRIAGTVRNILNLGGKGVSGLAGLAGSGLGYAGMGLSSPASDQRTVIQDWADKFASSPFLAMARNERFDRMREQANKNLALEAAKNKQASQAAPLQIYKHFLGELGYNNPDLTPEQRGLIEQTAYDKTLSFLQASRSSINIGGEAGPKWMDDINKKRYEDLMSAADNADMTERMADELIKGIESGEFTTGGGSFGAAALKVANAFNLSSEAQQRYSALFNSFSMERRKNLLSSFKGSISNKEQDIITEAIGGLGSSPQSNLTFLKLAKLSARLATESRAKYNELASLGLNRLELESRFDAYLRDRASKTAAEVAAIAGNKTGANGRRGTKLEIVE